MNISRQSLTIFFGLGLWLLIFCVQAQPDNGNSPYSQFGSGDMHRTTNIRQMGMGYTGLALPHSLFASTENPAFLPYNRIAGIEAAGFIQRRDLSKGSLYEQNTQGGFSYIHILIPFKNPEKLTMVLGAAPYSRVSYAFEAQSGFDADSNFLTKRYGGTGTMSRAFLSAGYRLNNHIYVGLESNYVFGNIQNSQETFLNASSANNAFFYLDDDYQNGFYFAPAVSARYALDSTNKTFLNGTIKVSLPADLSVDNERYIFVRNVVFNETLGTDTLNSITKSASLPLIFSTGIGLDNPGRWALGADVHYELWDNTETGSLAGNRAIGNKTAVSLGGEWTPGSDKLSFFSLMTYRAGAYYENYTMAGNTAYDVGINFGFSIPVINKHTQRHVLPYINTAFSFGQREASNGFGITERYGRASLSFSINDQWWFKRSRIK